MVYRLVLFDLVNNIPLAEAIEDNEEYDTIKNFLIKTVAPKDRIVIVSDNGAGYEKIMDELNFDHQLCTFHLEKHLRNLINKQSNKIAREYRAKLKKYNPSYSKTKLNEMGDKKKKEFKDEMDTFLEKFMKFREQETWLKAIDYIEQLKKELHSFPDFLSEYIWKNFMPIYKK